MRECGGGLGGSTWGGAGLVWMWTGESVEVRLVRVWRWSGEGYIR